MYTIAYNCFPCKAIIISTFHQIVFESNYDGYFVSEPLIFASSWNQDYFSFWRTVRFWYSREFCRNFTIYSLIYNRIILSTSIHFYVISQVLRTLDVPTCASDCEHHASACTCRRKQYNDKVLHRIQGIKQQKEGFEWNECALQHTIFCSIQQYWNRITKTSRRYIWFTRQ